MLEQQNFLDLTGKVAVITGAASGIGLGVAQLLSAHGATVAMLDVDEKGKDEADAIRDAGRSAVFFHCDVTSDSEVKATVATVVAEFGRIDCLFNNAGVTVRKTVVELEEREWDFVLDV